MYKKQCFIKPGLFDQPLKGIERETTMDAVRAENLTKRFGDFTAVDHVSFTVRKGEVFGFLGPNGAGKTTTISMLCTLLQPNEGTASIGG